MAPPSPKHQEIAGELFSTILQHIKSKDGSCKPYIAPFAVFLNDDDKNIELFRQIACTSAILLSVFITAARAAICLAAIRKTVFYLRPDKNNPFSVVICCRILHFLNRLSSNL